MAQPRIKFTVDDYMTAPPDKRYQLLDGDMILAPAPTNRHQYTVGEIFALLRQHVRQNGLGQVRVSPYDVVLSRYDVAQPDGLFVSNERSHMITAANIQGTPDLVVEVLSPSSREYDRGYKSTLYFRSGVRDFWLVDPDAETAEVLLPGEPGFVRHAIFRQGDILTSPLLPGLVIELAQSFAT